MPDGLAILGVDCFIESSTHALRRFQMGLQLLTRQRKFEDQARPVVKVIGCGYPIDQTIEIACFKCLKFNLHELPINPLEIRCRGGMSKPVY